MSQHYEKWNPEAIEEEALAIDDESEFFKLKPGTTVLRILPPRPGTGSPFLKVWQHWVQIPGQAVGKGFACPRLNTGAKYPCPVCQLSDQLRASANPADQEAGQDMRASKRVYLNAIVRGKEELGPRKINIGKSIYNDLMDLANDDEWGDFSDPGPDGYDVAIKRSGTGKFDTKYKVKGSRRTRPLSDDPTQLDAWLSAAPDLSVHARIPSEDELSQWGFGAGSAAVASLPAGDDAEEFADY